MIVLLKIILILTLGTILFQDMKDRLVWWFLYPAFGLIGGYIYLQEIDIQSYLYSLSFNILFVSTILGLLWLYIRYKMKKSFFKAFGLGEVLLLFAMALVFPPYTFLLFFFFSIVFALFATKILGLIKATKTSPAAGLMCLFFILVYIANWSGLYHQSIYAL